MLITVTIPTYRRLPDLKRCLEALQKQTRPANQVLVIIRDTDTETWQFFETFDPNVLPLRTVKVKVPGVVAAMNAGLDVAQGDIIAFTDDDAAPHTDWLARIEHHFLSDPRIGGVGGRDMIYYHGELWTTETKQVVGRLQWFGRLIGNHHLGIGTARYVDVFKGVNMSFRQSAIKALRFEKRMHGTGAQVDFEIPFCLALKRNGWKLIYDPNVVVNHYPAPRFDEDQRHQFNPIALTNAVHNETLALLEHLPRLQRIIFIVWAILVGTRKYPGFVQWLRFLPSQGSLAGQQWLASIQGRWQGWSTWKESRMSKNV